MPPRAAAKENAVTDAEGRRVRADGDDDEVEEEEEELEEHEESDVEEETDEEDDEEEDDDEDDSAAAATFPSPPASLKSTVETLLAAAVRNDNGPGAVVGVATQDGIAFVVARGLANVRECVPLTANHVFDLASCSKHITAAAVLQLVERGLVSLDDPVQRHIPDFALPLASPQSRPVLVRDLLLHTSGIEDDSSTEHSRRMATAEYTNEAHLAWLNTCKPYRAPGVKHSYCNAGYVLLSLLVERVVRRPFGEHVMATFIAPLRAMPAPDTAFVMQSLTVRDEHAASTVVGYKRSTKRRFARSRMDTCITGDGNVFMSVPQLLTWLIAFRAGAAGVSRATIERVVLPHGHLDNGKEIEYSCGGLFGQPGGVVGHNGSWMGTATAFAFGKARSFAVAVLSNDESFDAEELVAKVVRAVRKVRVSASTAT
jgi:CubicO group peptidase (beta-lactamase class C family)